MVSDHRDPGSVVCTQRLLAAVEVGLAFVRFRHRRAAGAGQPMCRSCVLYPFAGVPRRANETPSDDRLPVFVAAAGAAWRAASPWADSLAQTSDYRLRVP